MHQNIIHGIDVSTYQVLTGWEFPAAHGDSPCSSTIYGDSPEPYYISSALLLEILQSLILYGWRNVFNHNY
ncbi:hypothetical protein SCLCIDRAFT_34736 [Scleroderma citrinum Foug A]|uniref:Uncharacterized protein n=1 Tax=Scleroderma citrinum Foug A TaxID=1036808 RepID=A0A0C3CMX4_9AGAM|nr:hypothetical protein SCLCIDRAFT_34743 [Scleroderma citrinum Foug A]KIM50040.1 hypothetical protein SCLCIDRAFT_34736 [Scleroderma citrinum Foug A]